MVFKRKQIVVLSLILMIVVAGYLNYSYNKSSVSVSDLEDVSVSDSADSETTRLGEAVFVDNTLMTEAEKSKDKENKDKDTDKDKNTDKDNKKALQASKEANDFFAQAKMDRDVTRGRDTEALKEITEDPQASKELKSQAYEQMMKILGNSDREMRIETLIKNKGFSDVVVLFGNDGSMDIVVKAPSLSAVQVAQISDIASRQAKIDIKNIHVRSIF